MSKACLITWSLCKYREKVEPWGMAWLSWNQILHSFVYTFNIFLLVDILSKPSAENTKIIDLDIHCFMGETDRCVCYGGKGRVLGESLVGTARLRLGMKDDPSHWQRAWGWGKGIAFPEQINMNGYCCHSPEMNRKDEPRHFSSQQLWMCLDYWWLCHCFREGGRQGWCRCGDFLFQFVPHLN